MCALLSMVRDVIGLWINFLCRCFIGHARRTIFILLRVILSGLIDGSITIYAICWGPREVF